MNQVPEVAIPLRPLPDHFVVHTSYGGREGYALYRWIDGGNDDHNRKIHALRAFRHDDLYYNIIDDTTLPTNYTSVKCKKAQGNIIRTMIWKYTGKVLRYTGNEGNRRYPVINITNISTVLPPHRTDTFIPTLINNHPAPTEPAAPVPPVPTVPTGPKIYTIAIIPQHAVRAFLRDAAMQEEVCSITGDEIDITNGAMTSCFHIFEKNAIAMWLAMPNSRDKCPVCNCKCNMFTIDSEEAPQQPVPQD